jgi:hypothetical protein
MHQAPVQFFANFIFVACQNKYIVFFVEKRELHQVIDYVPPIFLGCRAQVVPKLWQINSTRTLKVINIVDARFINENNVVFALLYESDRIFFPARFIQKSPFNKDIKPLPK